MKKFIKVFVSTFLFTLSACASKEQKTEITVLAAASLIDALEEIKEIYSDENTTINISYGASGTLQNQIEQGVQADLFISASEKPVTQLTEKGYVSVSSILLKNNLVLIVPKDNTKIQHIKDILNDDVSHIALGEFESVPAGQYAKEALTNLNMLDAVTEKAVYGSDVRAVLQWVESGEADCGIVYESDALTSDNVRIVEKFSSNTHTEITYLMAKLKDSKHPAETINFMKYLSSDDAKKVWEEKGFLVN